MSGDRVVVVVDDDRAVLDSLKFLLETAGYRVAAYESPTAFLANWALEDGATSPACLIIDQHMREMNGLDLIAGLHARAALPPALLITAAPSPAIAARASQFGVTMLEKPPAEADLLTFIDAHF
jgi:two-component system response regulator FixJ